MIWANTFNRFDPASPFGGYKESGYGREGGRHGLLAYLGSAAEPRSVAAKRDDAAVERRKVPRNEPRLTVPKTYKLYIGGQVPAQRVRAHLRGRLGEGRASSPMRRRAPARTPATPSSPLARPSRAGRGPPRTTAGRCCTASPSCSEGRRAQFIDEIVAQQGVSASAAAAQVDEAIDRWVWYAGWCDKYAQVSGNANPVSGPYFNISVPEPTGVVAIVAPQDSALAGARVGRSPRPSSAGNTVVVVASERFPLSAISLAEVLATSRTCRAAWSTC